MKAKGFITLYLIGALLLVGALGTIAYKLDQRGYKRGEAEVKAEVAKRDNEALKQALNSLKLAQDRVRKLEDTNKADLALAAATLKKGLDNAEKAKQRVIADLNSGTLKLRVQLAGCTALSNRDPTSATSPGGLDNNATPQSGLLGQADSTFLVNLASEADTVVHQLTACQVVLTKDREATK